MISDTFNLNTQTVAGQRTRFIYNPSSNLAYYAYLNEDEDCLDNWQSEIPFELDAVTPFQNTAGQKSIGDEMVYFQLIWPRPALYIIGRASMRGHLHDLPRKRGYAVHLLDWRASLCNEFNFPMAVSFQIGDVETLINNIAFSSLDSVVIMTHDFQLDVKLVQRLRDRQLLYLGILGSKKRTERLLERDNSR